jgi:chemotaxis protein MotB
VSHGGHPGGAWKVAYPDFVTAMMALFIVLWLPNSSDKVKKAVGGYFKDPTGTSKMVGSDMPGSGENFIVNKDNMEDLKEQLQKSIREAPKFDKLENHIDMTVTDEGLRIELTESAAGTFFDSGSARMSSDGSDLLKLLGQELGKLPNHIAMEGHTDSKQYLPGATYGNWELSADRANAARRMMQENGIRADQVTHVRGFADQRLRKPDAPQDPSNRRISLIVQYLEKSLRRKRQGAKKRKARAEQALTKKAPRKRARKRKSSAGFRSAFPQGSFIPIGHSGERQHNSSGMQSIQ